MKKINRLALLPMLVATLVGCSTAQTVRLHPSNDAAMPGGVIVGTFEAQGLGSGSVTLRAPGGEVFKGGYLLREYFSQGTAFAAGDKGTKLECEYYNEVTSRSGRGGCRSSKGEQYRLEYDR